MAKSLITTVVSCTVTNSTISGGSDTGGITGYMDDYNTVGYCTVTDNTIEGYYAIGGIAGYAYYNPTITNCIVSGGSITSITMDAMSASILGEIYDEYYTTIIRNCRSLAIS